MKRGRGLNYAVIIICSVLLVILLLISLRDYVNQVDVNNRIEDLKVVENVEGQLVEHIDPNALSAYLSSLDHRTISHEVIVAIIGVFFTFLAFYVQYSFNSSQREDMSRERFENGYSHLLDVFRSIWKDIEVPMVGKGKIAMHYMFYEYKAIFNQLASNKVLQDGSDIELINKVAFSIFINGISENLGSDIQICKLSGGERKRIASLCEKLSKARHDSESGVDGGVTYIMDYKGKKIKYFDGHRMRLIPYFKYLMSIFDYLRENENRYDKNTTLKQLFAEMSDHEIGLVYSFMKFRDCRDYDDYLNFMKQSIDPEYAFKFLYDSTRFIRK